MLLPQFQVNGYRITDLQGRPLGLVSNWKVNQHRDVTPIHVNGGIPYYMTGPRFVDMDMNAQFDIFPPMVEFDDNNMTPTDKVLAQSLFRNISFQL